MSPVWEGTGARSHRTFLLNCCSCFSSWQTPAATGTAPPPVHKVFRKWGRGRLTVDLIQPWSPVTHLIFTNHHNMGKSGHTRRIQKAARSTANNPTNTTPGMELLENPTVGHAGPKTGHPMHGETHSQSGQPPMAPRSGPQRSAGKAPAALTTLWKGGRSMRREGRCPLRGSESGHPPGEETAPPAAGGGPSKDSWIRDGPQSAEEGARLRGEPSPPTGGGPGPPSAGESDRWTKGTGTTRLATEKRRRLVWSLKQREIPEIPRSREGGLIKNVAPTSASETPVPLQPLPCQRF